MESPKYLSPSWSYPLRRLLTQCWSRASSHEPRCEERAWGIISWRFRGNLAPSCDLLRWTDTRCDTVKAPGKGSQNWIIGGSCHKPRPLFKGGFCHSSFKLPVFSVQNVNVYEVSVCSLQCRGLSMPRCTAQHTLRCLVCVWEFQRKKIKCFEKPSQSPDQMNIYGKN